MKREDIKRAVNFKSRALYQGSIYLIIGYSYQNITKPKEAVVLKDINANSIINAPMAEVELYTEHLNFEKENAYECNNT